MNHSRYYKAFGLVFDSQLEIPEMKTTGRCSEADVTISIGSVPDELKNSASAGSICQARAGEFLLKMPEIGRFYVKNGRSIVIEPEPHVEEKDLRIFLLGSSMGALMHQRGILALHASAVVINGRALLFCGQSGAGKSTLAGAFVGQGYEFLTDDIAAITLNENGTPIAHPGLSRMKLWRDSAMTLEYEPEELPLVRSGTINRFSVEPDAQAPSPVPLAAIFALGHSNEDEFQSNTKTLGESFASILANTYRVRYLDGLEARISHFPTASQVSKCVPIHQITRPDQPFRIDELMALILELCP